jgi:hypothetical protein
MIGEDGSEVVHTGRVVDSQRGMRAIIVLAFTRPDTG